MVDGPFSTFPRRRLRLWRSATGKISVEQFVQWASSIKDTAKQVYIREISWVKEPRFPSHEYILLTFGDKSDPDTIYDTTLRLERDTDSWFKIFGSWFGSNCRDTVSIWNSSLAAQHSKDREIAHISVNRTDIDIRYITILLEVVGKAADEYKVWSFNCWWFAGCLWRNLARCIGSNHYRFRLIHREGQMEKFAKFLAETRGSKGVDEWDAMTFSHFQSYSHLASVERAAGDNTELEHATEYIEEIFEIWASGKFKGQFSQTEGLHKTPDPIPELFKLSDCQIDATIAIMGATGTGKSSFIKSITNDEEIVVGRSLEYIHHFRYFVPNTTTWINFIDAPGYDDSQGATDGLTQADILRNIASFLAAEYGQMRKLDGIIYMHRISDPRTVNSQRNLLMIKKLVCSAESMRNVVIITTMWDKLKSPQDGERLELELRTKDGFFKSLLDQGDQLVRLGHGVTGPKFPSTHQIVSDLIMHSQIGSMGNYGGR